jgi:signal transduction histidine kinase
VTVSVRSETPELLTPGQPATEEGPTESRPRRLEASSGLVLALGAAIAVGLVAVVVDGMHGALVMFAILAPVGVLTVGGVAVALGRLGRFGGLRRQLALVGTIAIGQFLLAIGLLVELMFVSRHDAVYTGLVAIYAGLLGGWAARALGRRLLHDVGQIRAGLAAVGDGAREISIAVAGDDELAGLASEVERMVERLATEERARSAVEAAHRDLIAAVSHDLRTPITSLRLLADALRDEVVDPRSRLEYVSRIATHVTALSGLIDDLFELSRLQAGDVRWAIEQVPLDELVLETVDAMRPEADAHSVAVRAELPDDLFPVRGNPEQIQRVLFNLIQNAIRHTPADGSVTVRAQPTGEALEIEVADTGAGIPTAERERVFEAFFQGSSRAARTDGSAGLGLAISRAIVEAHGGRIWVADGADGTRVRFSLPRAVAA